jgi:hypothetical protein
MSYLPFIKGFEWEELYLTIIARLQTAYKLIYIEKSIRTFRLTLFILKEKAMKKIKHLFLAMMIFAVLGLSYFVTSAFAQNQIQKSTKSNYNKHKGQPSLMIQKGSKGLLKRNERMEIPDDDERRF